MEKDEFTPDYINDYDPAYDMPVLIYPGFELFHLWPCCRSTFLLLRKPTSNHGPYNFLAPASRVCDESEAKDEGDQVRNSMNQHLTPHEKSLYKKQMGPDSDNKDNQETPRRSYRSNRGGSSILPATGRLVILGSCQSRVPLGRQ